MSEGLRVQLKNLLTEVSTSRTAALSEDLKAVTDAIYRQIGPAQRVSESGECHNERTDGEEELSAQPLLQAMSSARRGECETDCYATCYCYLWR